MDDIFFQSEEKNNFIRILEAEPDFKISVPVGVEILKDTLNNLKSRNIKIFIVHGHDRQLLDTAREFVRGLGFEPVVLQDQENSGKTLVEKLEENSDVGFAIVLLTPDDICRSEGEETHRGRQNVILELGYFWGLIGRKRTCILYKEEVELPSDIDGLTYINLIEDWKEKLRSEIQCHLHIANQRNIAK